MRSDNGSEIVQLPHAEVDTEFVRFVDMLNCLSDF